MDRCTVHVASCPKCRRKVITADAGTRLEEIIRQVCAERGAHMTELETMPDQVRLLVECDPKYGIHRLVKQIKGPSSRPLRQEFPSLKSKMPTLWTNNYSAATVGGATPEIVNSMSLTSTTHSAPHLPTAKAGGFTARS